MTHARQKNSLSRYRPSLSWERVGGLSQAETSAGGARPGFSKPKRGRPKKVGLGKRKGSNDLRVPEKEVGEVKKERKLYPLRGRTLRDTITCRVLLTRLEESGGEERVSVLKSPKGIIKEEGHNLLPEKTMPCRIQQKVCKAYSQALESEKQSKVPMLPVVEPRKRRLASLNAEAVNSLLMYRENLQGSRLTKTLQINGTLANGATTLGHEVSQGDTRGPKVAKADICATGNSRKSQKTDKTEDVDLLALYSPTPRRQAGLNAAAMLKITSSSFKVRHRVAKTSPNQPRTKQSPRPKLKKEGCRGLQFLRGCRHIRRNYLCCPEPGLAGTAEGPHGSVKSGFQSQSLLGYPMKYVNEEHSETPGTPSYCCSKARLAEFCHRMALFLDQEGFGDSKSEARSLPKSTAPSPHSLVHPHALAVGPRPYSCFPGCYVPFAHYEDSPLPMTSASSDQIPFLPSKVAPIALWPGKVQSSKLLSPAGSQPSEIAHPVYCYEEPCQISGYAYRAASNITSRRCCFDTGVSGRSQSIWTDCSSSREDCGPRSVWVSAAPRPPSGCPASPSAPPSAQSVPRLRTPLSDPSQPQVPLHVARECPQSAKAPSGSRSEVPGGSPAVCPHIQDRQQLGPSCRATSRAAKQHRISRRRATNGWLPVGLPFKKEVFAVGEETAVLRTCFEAVQRDGEVIGVRDTVLLRSGPRKKSQPYVAKISALWQDSESGEMMMSLFWYYRPEHTQGGRNPYTHSENEIFASRHQDQNSVACIEDKCYVLTLAQYCRFCALVKCRAEGLSGRATGVVPPCPEYAVPPHRRVPADIEPHLVFVCRHVYDFRYGRVLKNLQ
ncbi:bromo adjacent homology domain-containing 1 protein isoform X2 [Esox lucius]|uniref:bromo adjacent homology domain-containing 1 protein isoform X2 n=1 Tax=Esox lucius TaxID=8010 RepID=UPI000576D8A7|nr:bromo adjacent homology domain-containing 1 protein isoform X2 [Esox lucius]